MKICFTIKSFQEMIGSIMQLKFSTMKVNNFYEAVLLFSFFYQSLQNVY
jgi:hypothetical protein